MNKTADFFHSYSEKFSSIYGQDNSGFNKIINRLFRKTMLIRYLKTLESCQPITGKSVLDVGCGPGHYCTALAKMGAGEVVGIDFAQGMLELAAKQAKDAGVDNICRFETHDFMQMNTDKKYNYIILMGFMDYMSDPLAVINKAADLTLNKALFSFPCDDGILAWQRKIRYRHKCPLYLYNHKQLQDLFGKLTNCKVTIENISRDFFVTIEKTNNS